MTVESFQDLFIFIRDSLIKYTFWIKVNDSGIISGSFYFHQRLSDKVYVLDVFSGEVKALQPCMHCILLELSLAQP